MNKRKNNRINIVYSTDPEYDYSQFDDQQETLAPADQELTVHIEKKGRGGKAVVLVKGFVGNDDDLQELAKLLKSKCGVGGSAKEGMIVIQGENRKKVMQILEKEGYKTKRVGA